MGIRLDRRSGKYCVYKIIEMHNHSFVKEYVTTKNMPFLTKSVPTKTNFVMRSSFLRQMTCFIVIDKVPNVLNGAKSIPTNSFTTEDFLFRCEIFLGYSSPRCWREYVERIENSFSTNFSRGM